MSFSLKILVFLFGLQATQGFTAESTTGLIELSSTSHKFERGVEREQRAQLLAYFQLEISASLLHLFSNSLEQLDSALARNPYADQNASESMIQEIHQMLLKNLEEAAILGFADKEISALANHWQARLKLEGQRDRLHYSRDIASTATRFQMKYDEMSSKLTPLRARPYFKKHHQEMRLRAAKAITLATLKLVSKNNNKASTARALVHSSPSIAAIHAIKNQKIQNRDRVGHRELIISMLKESQNHLRQIVEAPEISPIELRARKLIRKQNQEIKRLQQMPSLFNSRAATLYRQIVAENQFEIKHMLYQWIQWNAKESS